MKPLLVGMNNPVSSRPEHALFPYPPGCAGWRLWKMTGLSRSEYMAAFDRVNLCEGDWNIVKARERIVELQIGQTDRRCVLVGYEVWRAYRGSDAPQPFIWHGTVAVIPHPSGRNLMFNDPDVKMKASRFLRELYRENV